MGNKKIVFSLALVSLLLVAFWLGKVTGRVGKSGETSHEKIPAAPAKSHDEAAPHAHEDGQADGHDEGKEATAGLKLGAEEKANIGLKTVVADLRPIESVIRISGGEKPHPDKEPQANRGAS